MSKSENDSSVRVLPGRQPGELRVGSYGVLWGDAQNRDIAGEYFDAQTAELTAVHARMKRIPLLFYHGLHNQVGATVVGEIDVMRPDKTGLWVEGVIQDADAYRKDIEELVRHGKLFWSSGALPATKRVEADGRLSRWAIAEMSMTPKPAEYRMLARPIAVIKSDYHSLGLDWPEEAGDAWVKAGEAMDIAAALPPTNAGGLSPGIHSSTQGGFTMNLQESLATAIASAKTALEQGDVETGQKFRQEAETYKSALDELGRLDAIGQTVMRPPLPGAGAGAVAPLPVKAEMESAAFGEVYVTRFGAPEEALKGVMTDLIGRDYRQTLYDQYGAFAAYLRGGDRAIDNRQAALLRQQVFAPSQIKGMIADGYDVATIKTTMVEAQGTLGGFAVPANVQQDIITRLPGLTAVRAGGARVVDLVTGNMIEVPEYTGGTDRYRGALRGVWGAETASPSEKNATLGLKQIFANLYTYKVAMSQTLVEDAANLVSLVTQDILDTMAIDEDDAFLVGNGVGKPHGLLPASANANSLTEVKTASASALTTAGIIALPRGVGSQYRRNLSVIGNSDTFALVEQLTVSGTGSDLAFDLEDGTLRGATVRESEAMPDVGSNTFPLLVGDLSGYWIVQRAGLAIVRFQDSNTGINKVEYHVRRRVGGYPAEPWKFAVQKCAT